MIESTYNTALLNLHQFHHWFLTLCLRLSTKSIVSCKLKSDIPFFCKEYCPKNILETINSLKSGAFMPNANINPVTSSKVKFKIIIE